MTLKLILKYCFIFILCLTVLSCKNEVKKEKDFISILEKTYSKVNDFLVMEVNYDRINFNPYQSYDFKAPDRLIINNRIQMDNKHSNYFASRLASFPGGFQFSQQEFQNDTVNIVYDSLGVVFGRSILNQDLSQYQKTKEKLNQVLDYKIIQELIKNKDSIRLFKKLIDKNLIEVKIHDLEDTVTYTFNSNTLNLKSLEKSKSKEKWRFNSHEDGFSRHIAYYKNEKLKFEYRINNIKALKFIPKSNLDLPKYIDKNNVIDYQDIEISNLSKNLYLVSNVARDRNVLFKVNRNNITVFGAPISYNTSKQVASLINTKFPNKKITSVYVTHSHSDHIGGLLFYIEKGATIIADSYTIEAIKKYPKFSDSIQKFNFQAVTDSDEKDGVKYYIPKNTHSKGQSFAYFLEDNILYQGDFLEIAKDNTTPKHISETARVFTKFLRVNSIKPKRIIGHHRNANIDIKFLDVIK